MKKIYLLLLFVFGFSAFAQKKGISYQAVIINPKEVSSPGYNGTSIPLANKAICLSFQIVNSTNQVEYQESQSITSDAYGMVNVVIGTGTSGTGLVDNLDDVNWNQGNKKLVVGVNIEGVCSNYTEISNQVLNYTPYSFYAQNADIRDGYVTTVKLADGAVTDPKVAMGINPAKVGLGNVNNTSDANKPVSTATQTSLNLKENTANKSINVSTDGTSDVKFPSVKAVKTYVDSVITSATIADADDVTKGKIQLAGDLSGTAALPTVPGLALKENTANKSINVSTDGTSDVKFPSVKAVKTYVDSVITSATIADADDVTKGKIQLAGDLSGTAALPTIANDAVTTLKILDANVTNAKIATGIDAAKLADGSVSNTELQYIGTLSSNAQTQLDAKAPIASPTFTGTVSGITSTMVGLGNVENTALSIWNGSTAITTLGTITTGTVPVANVSGLGTAATYDTGTTAGTIPVLDGSGKLATSILPISGLSYQGALSLSANPTIPIQSSGNYYIIGSAGIETGSGLTFGIGDWIISNGTAWSKIIQNSDVSSVAGKVGVVVLTSSDVGLGNVSNTSDANKPISTATQTALDLKANIASPTFTGTVTAPTLVSGALTYPNTDGTANQILKTNGSGALSWTDANDGLTHFTESTYTNDSKTGVKLLATNAGTNVDVVISPKGDGGILAQQPDGTVTGGNNRGINTVDLQTIRSANTQVASGNYSSISGGINNRSSEVGSAVSGGTDNTASGRYSVVSGGNNNTASINYAVVSGGNSNLASGTSAVVSGGDNNTASSNFAVVSGGSYNTASALFSRVSGGYNSTASALFSTVLGGEANTASGMFSLTGGLRNTASSFGEITLGLFATNSGGSAGSYVTGDRLFALGNGTADGARSNALTVLKNGNTTIAGALTTGAVTYPAALGTANQVLKMNAGATDLEWGTAGGSGDLVATNNLSDVSNDATARTNLGLGNVDNTSDANKPVSIATQTALDLKAPIASPTFTGTVTAPTLVSGALTYPNTDGTANQILKTNGSGALSWTDAYDGLTHFTESTYTNDSRTGVKLLATNAEANVDVVISPKGDGGILAHQPDDAVTGGDNRGSYTVDLQTIRNANTQVASNTFSVISGGAFNTSSATASTVSGGIFNNVSAQSSVISGGSTNTVSNDYSVVSGGQSNTVSGGGYSVVSGGLTNTVSGNYSLVSGGTSNAVSNDYSVVSGGQSNDVTGGYSVVSGGFENTVSELYSVVSGGSQNTVSSSYSVVSGGYGNTSSGNRSTVLGGQTNTASGAYSLTGGLENTASSYGELTLGLFATNSGGTAGSYVAGDRLFALGNGTADGARSNALTVLKNGNTTIAGALTTGTVTYPATLGTANQVLKMNAGATALEWGTAGSGSGDLLSTNNLSDVSNAATARTNLGLGNVDNTSDANKPVSTATQTALDLKANIASPTFTGMVTAPTLVSGAVTYLNTLGTANQVLKMNAGATALEWGTVSSGSGDLLSTNNLSDLSNAASARTNLGLGNVENTALPTWNGSTAITTLGTITTGTVPVANVSGLGTSVTYNTGTTAGTIPVLDGSGKLATSILPISGLSYQGALSLSANPTVAVEASGNYYIIGSAGTETGSGLTFGIGDWMISNGTAWAKIIQNSDVSSVAGKIGVVTLNATDVGLGNVDNTSDANKPISTAAQTALNAKAPMASPIFTGTVTAPTLVAGGITYPVTNGTNGQVLITNGSGTATWTTLSAGSGDLVSTNNLFDLSNKATARTNLGLGTIATQAVSSVAITGGAINGTSIGATTASTAKFTTLNTSGRVGIGTSSPNASAALDITSTTGSLLLPRLTTTERDALSPENGMVIYNSTLDVFQVANGGTGTATIAQDIHNQSAGIKAIWVRGQTFQATASGAFSINIGLGPVYTAGNIQLRLYTNNTKSTLLATSNSVAFAVGSAGYHTFNFTGFDLVNTTSYYFESYITDAFDGSIFYNTGNPYAGGDANIGAGIDLKFSVSIGSDASWTSLLTQGSYTFPSTDGQSGEVLSTDGSGTLSWATKGYLVSTNNLSDVSNAATARTNLGLAIGTNVQAYDADLADLADGSLTATKIADGTVDNTEFQYLNGVTSAIQTQIIAKASLASPALTGVPTAPTATAGTNTTQIATTAFVKDALTTATPEATETVRGGIELFSNTDQTVAANAVSTTASRTYGLQLNSAGQGVVNVPWVDNNTTYTAGTGLTLSGTQFVNSAPHVATNLSVTGGTTSGPTINSSTGINVVIPSASSSASGAVTTTTQTFAGEKTFQNTATFNGNSQYSYSFGYLNPSGGVGSGSTVNANYSILATHRIKAAEFNAVSDRRIKTDIKPIENSLATIAKLKPAEYTKIDTVQFGSQKHYGFIAQEVEEILPEAVVKGEGEIPVLKKFNEVDFEEGVEYKIVIKDNDKEAIISYKKGDAIKVDDIIIVRSKVVNDFRAVNYDAVFSVAVSAIQEQQTLIQNQKQEIDTIKSELNAIKDALLKSGIKIK